MREGNNFNLPHTPKGESGMRGLIRLVRTKPAQILFVSGLVILVLFLLIISIILNSLHAPNYISAATSPDAIAIRVIPNPDHYSPLHWYQNQGFTGSPQSLTVDGYEAVRDGRTVYVNAANVDAANLYTNIYLISYNQDAESATVDIFGRILEHWKFNTNVSGTGYCSEPNTKSDCAGAIGCWQFEGDFKDSSGKGHNGVKSGGVTFGSGIIGQAADFDGKSGSYIDAGKIDYSGWTEATFSAWVKAKDFNTHHSIICNNESTTPGGGFWTSTYSGVNQNIYFEADCIGNCAIPLGYYGGISVPFSSYKDKWTFVAYTINNSFMKIYINGQEVSSRVTAEGVSLNSIYNTYIGRVVGPIWNGYEWNGLIDEVKIYDRALSASEIQDNYSQVYSQCLADSECSSGGYCSSLKSRIIRDTLRLSELVEVKLKLAEFKQSNNHYPKLDSGTYLTNKTISTWPSWQETLAQELGAALPLDPINKLGACSGYDSITCWDEQTKKFAGSLPDNLPTGSNVMIYTATSTGASYDICAVMESGYLTGMAQGACPTSYVNISKTAFNNPPLITGVNLPTVGSGKEYIGYVSATDPDGDILSWSINTSGTAWVAAGWSAPPVLQPAGTNSQKKIYAAQTGNIGPYSFDITVSDGRGGEISQTYTITITIEQSLNPPVVDPVADKTVIIGKNLSFTITASDPNNKYPLNFLFNNSPSGFAGTGSLDINQHDYNMSGLVIDQTKTYNVSVVAANKYGNPSNPVAFMVTVENQAPQITSISLTNATACVNYNYSITASDPDGHNVNNFSAAGLLPANLTINNSTGLISGQPQTTGAFNLTITAKDEYAAQTILPYSAQDSQNYTLTVVDEVFSVNPLSNATIYVAPAGVPSADLYHWPIIYFTTAGVTTSNPVTYSLSSKPAWLIIDANNGQMNGTPTDNTNDPGAYTITVAAKNKCGASSSANLNLTVTKNEWCGDTVIQAAEGEQCDDGNSENNDACDNLCQWSCKALNNITFDLGSGDAMLYDDNSNPNTAKSVAGGSYLKLATAMPTPYIWIANSDKNQVSKIRTFDGCKKLKNGWDCLVWETRGQLIGVYNVGIDPSRTAVNVETGEVWVANRGSGNVTKLDINGNTLKTCATGNTPRGVVIEANGDAWIANYDDGMVVKISGDDVNCVILVAVNVGDNPYGLAIDSNNNIWVSNRGGGKTQRIDTTTYAVTSYTTGQGFGTCSLDGSMPYGIAVDLNDNVWVADICAGVYKVNQSTGAVDYYAFTGLADPLGRSRGVTIDTSGSIWVAFDWSSQVVKIPDPSNPGSYLIYNVSGSFPIGICGDSMGQVWAVNYNSSDITVFDSNGAIVGTYPASSQTVKPYTYSDMTGLNRAMILRAGEWSSNVGGIFNSGIQDQPWGTVSWSENIPSSKQSIAVFLRANNSNLAIQTEPWIDSASWNALPLEQRDGRFLQIKVEMRSQEQGVTPVLWDLAIDCL